MGLGPSICQDCLVLMKLDDHRPHWYCPKCGLDCRDGHDIALCFLSSKDTKQLDKNCDTDFYGIHIKYQKAMERIHRVDYLFGKRDAWSFCYHLKRRHKFVGTVLMFIYQKILIPISKKLPVKYRAEWD